MRVRVQVRIAASTALQTASQPALVSRVVMIAVPVGAAGMVLGKLAHLGHEGLDTTRAGARATV
jgi:hypothetical protein